MAPAPEQSPSSGLAEDRPDERVLWEEARHKQSHVARERLFALYASYARGIARRIHREKMRSGDIEFADILQLANVGLIEAIDRYDPSLGAPFKSYASTRIAGNITDGITKMSELREQLSWRYRLQRERLKSLQSGDADNMSVPDALEALSELVNGLAVGLMLEGTGIFLAEEKDPSPNAYQSLAWHNMVEALQSEIRLLPEREQGILRHHYGAGMGFDDLASLFGVTRGRISQIHRAALDRLRKALCFQGYSRIEQ